MPGRSTDASSLTPAASERADDRMGVPSRVETAAAWIGPYQLLEKLGEGGFGEVWLAHQHQPVRRQVALKIIKPGMDSKQVVARFEAERQALAMMDHPNIAKILDAGTTGQESAKISAGAATSPALGRPYFVMELVRGSRITDYCDDRRLSTIDRIPLFILVCKAVQHAHQKGIIHRDLKPSNILVEEVDGVPTPKVIDFGIAKAMQQDLTDKTLVTLFTQFIGTPAYISPEQAEFGSDDIDTRSDIYSLGVLLYELLVGRTPFDPAEVVRGGIQSLQRIIREVEPVKPSTRLKSLSDTDRTAAALVRQTEAVRLTHQLSGDLDWIVLKCLEKKRSRRYETANGLAMDLQRFLGNEPVLARPPSTAYQILKAWQRHKVLFAAGITVALTLLTAVGVSTWQAAKARQSQQATQALLYVANMGLIGQAWEGNDLGRIRQLLDETATFPGRGFEWHYWHRQAHRDERTFRGHAARVWSANFSSDGQHVVTASDDGTAKVWEVATGHAVRTLPGHEDWVRSAAFSPDGRRIVTGSKDCIARIWDATSGVEIRRLLGHRAAIRTVSFSPDGHRIVTACQDGTAQCWDADTGRPLTTFRGHSNWVFSAAFAPDGQHLVTSGDDGTARIWKVESGQELRRLVGHVGNVRTAAFSPDGRQVVTAGQDGTARIWDSETGRIELTLTGHQRNVFSAAYSPDGTQVVTTSGDQTIRVWDALTGREISQLKGHGSEIYTAVFSRDGKRILTASDDTTSKIWDVAVPSSASPVDSGHLVFDYGTNVYAVAIAPDSLHLAIGGHGGRIQLRSMTTGDLLHSLPSHDTEVRSLAFSPDGRRLAAGHGDGGVRIWEMADGRLSHTFTGHLGGVNAVAFSADGSRLLTAGAEGRIKVRRTQDGGELLSLPPNHREAFSASFSPDGSCIVGGFESVVVLWQADTGAEILTLPDVPRARSSRFSPDGRDVVAASADRTIRLWNARGGGQRFTLTGHTRAVYAASFSPDGQRLVSASQDKSVKIWSTVLGRELLTLRGHTEEVTSAVFSPDGNFIVSGSMDGTARLWTAAPAADAVAPQPAGPGASRRSDVTQSTVVSTNRSKPLAMGLISRWLLLAPLPVPPGDTLAAVDAEQIPDEGLLRPRAREEVRANERSLTWEPLEQAALPMDLNSLVGRTSAANSVAYAVCYLVHDSPHSGVTFKIVSDDESKVYLNGQVIHRSNPRRNYVLEEETVNGLELRAGTNTIVFKIVNRIEYWRASLRVLDARGQEIPKLRVTLEPPP
ncbi:MAG: serine/threonine protein kinase [Verrucomicrobiales bacterium]|nr:serine/threonine protein kinase [Verrucomicrobiales bacterium]